MIASANLAGPAESTPPLPSTPRVASIALKLLAYCQGRDWSGHDPYDALNSPWLEKLGWGDSRVARIFLTQLLKRSPLDLRFLLRIPGTQNPKALALFLSAALKLERIGLVPRDGIVRHLIARIIALRSPNSSYYCWGYSFPWQTRTIVVPRGAPNLVCTTFVANALLDAYEHQGNSKFLDMARSAADYIVAELYYEDRTVATFSYPKPGLNWRIHNANFLAAALLARVYRHTGSETLARPALKAARYSASRQQTDGSWAYGELPSQRWIDNFHTGYNLSGLRALGRFLGTSEFEPAIRLGFQFYRSHFFRADGAPRYFHNLTYPIDIHCVAQSLLTLREFEMQDGSISSMLDQVYGWTMRNMWNGAGYFYYRKHRFGTIRTSYMRWSQAWMLLALATLAEQDALDEGRRITGAVACASSL